MTSWGERATLRPLLELSLPVTVLGPERPNPVLPLVLRQQGIRGPVALISAGWRYDEARDEPLREAVHVTVHNLRLYDAFREVERDAPDLAAAYTRKQEEIRGLRRRYRIAITSAVEAAQKLRDDEATEDSWYKATIAYLQAIDRKWIEDTDALHARFEQETRPLEHRLIRWHRGRIRDVLQGCEAVLIAGGHVGVLRNRMVFFGLERDLVGRKILAWSGGAMALCDQILLYHDHTAYGVGTAEILDRGLGLIKNCFFLPHARERLDLTPRNTAILAARLAPHTVIGLQCGAVLTSPEEAPHGTTFVNTGTPEAAFFFGSDGELRPLATPTTPGGRHAASS